MALLCRPTIHRLLEPPLWQLPGGNHLVYCDCKLSCALSVVTVNLGQIHKAFVTTLILLCSTCK